MSPAVVFRREAQADFDEAYLWYERRREGLGDEFLASVQEALERVAQSPEAPRILHRDIRRALVRRFPYGVFYRSEPDRIVVIAIMHNRQEPRRWQSRS